MLQQLEQGATTLSLLQDTYNGGVSIRQAHVRRIHAHYRATKCRI